MPQQNLMSLNLEEADLAEIKGAITVLREKLAPHLLSISPEERRELPKMGDKTVAFVQKSLEYCTQNAELLPPYLDLPEFEQDFAGVVVLREMHQPLLQLVEALEDSQLLLGSDAYQAALMFYGSVKNAKRSNVPGAETIYSDLSDRFPGASGKKLTEDN